MNPWYKTISQSAPSGINMYRTPLPQQAGPYMVLSLKIGLSCGCDLCLWVLFAYKFRSNYSWLLFCTYFLWWGQLPAIVVWWMGRFTGCVGAAFLPCSMYTYSSVHRSQYPLINQHHYHRVHIGVEMIWRSVPGTCTTEYTELQPLLSGVHSVMRVKSVLAGEGGGCTPTPSHYIYPYQ
jgi:hypothetical protein